MLITLLTDFGSVDTYAGVMEAVITSAAPTARVIHLSHGVQPGAVLTGAVMLADAVVHCPVGVHVAVVDPGVGSDRLGVVLRSRDGRFLVGPDNGVLSLAAERCGGVVEAYAIEESAVMRQPVSATFHGRDVFAPVAAALATGFDPASVGRRLDPASLVRVAVQPVTREASALMVVVMTIDRFGNAATNARGADLDAIGAVIGSPLWIRTPRGSINAVRGRTFADASTRGVVVIEDSAGWIALCVRDGSFAEARAVAAGEVVRMGVGPG